MSSGFLLLMPLDTGNHDIHDNINYFEIDDMNNEKQGQLQSQRQGVQLVEQPSHPSPKA